MNIHEKIRHFCDQCGSSYSVKQNLLNHIHEKHKESVQRKSPQHACKECGGSFGRAYNLCKNHQFRDRTQLLTCDRCGFSTKRSQQLLLHQVSTHTIINVKSYLYFIFNQINNHIKGKFNSSMLQKSSRCHPTRVLTRLFNCTKCKKGFTTAKAALKHEKDHHSEDGKPFKCKLCQVKFSHSWAVTNHLRKGRCKGSQTIS